MLAAVYNTVSDCTDLGQFFYRAVFRIRQCLQHQTDSILMICHRSVPFTLFMTGQCVADPAASDTNSLT